MPPRHVDGPGEGKFVTHAVAARWLEVHPDTLDRLAAREGWLVPSHHAKQKLWAWEDIYVLGYLLAARARAGLSATGDGPEDAPPKKS